MPKKIPLSREELWERFEINKNGKLIYKISPAPIAKVGSVAGTLSGDGYILVKIQGSPYLAHRIVYYMIKGKQPSILDHINGDRSDNRIENLRPATQSQNLANAKKYKKSSSSYKGVAWHNRDKKWCANIKIEDKLKHLGYFTDEIEAAKAYDKAALELFGEFARPNFPQNKIEENLNVSSYG